MKEQDQNTTVAMTQVNTSPDPSWKGLYRAGGITAFLYLILGIVTPGLMFLFNNYNTEMDGAATLNFIAANKTWWLVLQSLTLRPSILMVIVLVTIYIALKHLNKSLAMLGTVITCICQILFAAYYPILLGLVYLSDKYAVAMDAAQRVMFSTAAESLLAVNNAFNPIYESIFAIGVLFISLAMLKGVFHKVVAYLGIAAFAAAIIAMVLWPVIGISYFWWWFVFLIWFVAVGWKLFRLGGKRL